MNKEKTISIVIPVHNGAKNITRLCEEINVSLSAYSHEIILVDDGSKDNSWKVISELKQKLGDALTGIRLSKNFGQHNATICGVGYATGDFIITMDDDFRHDPKTISRLIEKQKSTGSEVIYGISKNYAGGYARSKASSILKKSTKYFSQHRFGDGSSYRLMTRSVVDRLKENRGHIIFIDEIIHWYTSRIDVVQFEEDNSKRGRSRYSILKLFRLYTEVVHNYAVWPLKAMIFIGALSSFITFLMGFRFIYLKYMNKVEVPGFTATIVAILFSSGLILLSLGIIGMYIFKLYQIQSGKPSFSVNKII